MEFPSQSPRRANRSVLTLVFGILLSVSILGFLIFGHLKALAHAGSQIEWGFVLLAALAAFGSYSMMAVAFRKVLNVQGFRMSFAEVLGVILVSSTANYLISSMGLSGFALKAHLLKKRRIPYATTVTASVLTSVILYSVLALVVGQGLAFLLVHWGGTRMAWLEAGFGAGIFVSTAALVSLLFYGRKLRSRLTRVLFRGIDRAVFAVSRSAIPQEEFVDFERQLEEGLDRVRRAKGALAATMVYTCFDWSLVLLTLYFAFRAVGQSLGVGYLSAGFTVGQATSLIPILPAGLGAMEGSMAMVFDRLGVDFSAALIAAIIYRVAFYVLPGLVSVFVLWGLKVSEPDIALSSEREAGAEEAVGN
jgi:uncharacterized protein (TIRG00374 family)